MTGDDDKADLVFDIRHSTARTLAPYWRLLRGVAPDAAPPGDEATCGVDADELLQLIEAHKASDTKDTPWTDFKKRPHALGNLWLPRWGPWGCLADEPDDDDDKASPAADEGAPDAPK